MTRERRRQEFAVKVFLESNEKDYNKNTVPSGYKGGRILNLESPPLFKAGFFVWRWRVNLVLR